MDDRIQISGNKRLFLPQNSNEKRQDILPPIKYGKNKKVRLNALCANQRSKLL
jgi:hypothetical protein